MFCFQQLVIRFKTRTRREDPRVWKSAVFQGGLCGSAEFHKKNYGHCKQVGPLAITYCSYHCQSFPLSVLWNHQTSESRRPHLVLRQVRTRVHLERRKSNPVVKTWIRTKQRSLVQSLSNSVRRRLNVLQRNEAFHKHQRQQRTVRNKFAEAADPKPHMS